MDFLWDALEMVDREDLHDWGGLMEVVLELIVFWF